MWSDDVHNARRPGEYEGDIVDGQYQGKGKLTWEDGSYYEGEFYAGEFAGWGEMHYIDGSVYKGGWNNNYPNLFGTWNHPACDEYFGYWKDGKPHGHGEWRNNKTGEFLAGNWDEDELTGYVNVCKRMVTSILAILKLVRSRVKVPKRWKMENSMKVCGQTTR